MYSKVIQIYKFASLFFFFFEVGCVLVVKNGTSGKEATCDTGDIMRHGFDPWAGKIPWRKTWQPTPLFLSGKSHGQRSLAGYSPWGRKSQTRLSD